MTKTENILDFSDEELIDQLRNYKEQAPEQVEEIYK